MNQPNVVPQKYIAHSFRATSIALRHGWLPGARYTNLRDVRRFDRLGFLDIDWKNYNFRLHVAAARATRPKLTVAQDIIDVREIARIIDQACELAEYCDQVVVVPKDLRLAGRLDELIPSPFLLGFSVPTRYGGTRISLSEFKRPVHLLGGRPDTQRMLAEHLQVASFDCNRFTLDAAYGDYFDGETFRPHPVGGYDVCLEASIKNINMLWAGSDAQQRYSRQGHPNLHRRIVSAELHLQR